MVVEAPPPSAFVVAQSQLLLKLPIVSLDPPTQLGGVDQMGDRKRWPARWRANTCPGRSRLQATRSGATFGVSLGPIMAPGTRPQVHGGEAGIELGVGSFTPGDGAPGLGVELGQGLGR